MKVGPIVLVAALLGVAKPALAQAPTRDATPHQIHMVPVDKDVTLEVVDWGGNGSPLIFLSGNGDTAHIFDSFAPRFAAKRHVYGITRRGFGESSKPAPTATNYAADRLGDDVLAVIDALKLNKPVLAGHSIAGEELSSIGSRHPEKVAGLIYLDAASGYAFYTGQRSAAALTLDANELQRQLELLKLPQGAGPPLKPLVREALESAVNVEKDLEDLQKNAQSLPDEPSATAPVALTPEAKIDLAMTEGEQKYTSIRAPLLAIFAWPANVPQTMVVQAQALEKAMPSARVVRLPNATHYVWRSNEAAVEREINAFMDQLPK